MSTVVPLDTPGLGDRTYLVHDGRVAFVRGVVGRRADHARLREPYPHDYVTGGYGLAREVGAQYLLNADDPVSFDRVGIRDGDVIAIGARIRVGVLLTPGHTHTHCPSPCRMGMIRGGFRAHSPAFTANRYAKMTGCGKDTATSRRDCRSGTVRAATPRARPVEGHSPQ